MNSIACLPPADRSDLFRTAAEQKSVTVQIIEKDFWVCWVLYQLSCIDSLGVDLFFKGGTSLSKVFHVIERMSEDIDLVIDRVALGFTGERDPTREDLSNNARERLIDALKTEAANFVEHSLLDALNAQLADILGESDDWSVRVDVASLGNANILYNYPTNEEQSQYLKPMVLLELGARGDAWPTVNGVVRPYVAEMFPDHFKHAAVSLQTISAQRTFWEKVTLLHSLVHLGSEKMIAAKPARHLYDIYQLTNHELGQRAIADTELLASVVKHKTTFYRRPSARYDLAVPGTLKIIPSGETVAALRAEYGQLTQEMIFGDAPDFDQVIEALKQLEVEINELGQ